ncbi:hypothetical protein KIPB_009083 [Kipferlia bialata]|uniref:Uncharacterized protein n=1 Tax=Kipferlia bialata TaxID=797122 RepID=A0A391NXW1_9EUKA|nr:hypothetical protein KIPB_009083 [Kipferlia bialata]|eukprot:g9083.t1
MESDSHRHRRRKRRSHHSSSRTGSSHPSAPAPVEDVPQRSLTAAERAFDDLDDYEPEVNIKAQTAPQPKGFATATMKLSQPKVVHGLQVLDRAPGPALPPSAKRASVTVGDGGSSWGRMLDRYDDKRLGEETAEVAAPAETRESHRAPERGGERERRSHHRGEGGDRDGSRRHRRRRSTGLRAESDRETRGETKEDKDRRERRERREDRAEAERAQSREGRKARAKEMLAGSVDDDLQVLLYSIV